MRGKRKDEKLRRRGMWRLPFGKALQNVVRDLNSVGGRPGHRERACGGIFRFGIRNDRIT